jgi:2-hydroxy-3-oxopropionate reductase
MDKPRIGFFGTGIMGAPMVRRLLAAGYPVSVWNRTPDKYAALLEAGATAPGSPAAVAAASDIIVAMLMEPAHLDAILDGPSGIEAGLRPGSIVIDMGTHPPRNAQALAERFAAAGATSLDAPVRGGVQGAVDGRLMIMAGGEQTAFERARPVFETLGTTIVYAGPAGSGQVAKAAHQLVVMVSIQAVAEALALAQAFGADQSSVRDVLLGGQAASGIIVRQGAQMIARDWKRGRPIKDYLKDEASVTDALAGTHLRLPISDAVFERIHAFVDHGNGLVNEAALYTLLDPDSSPPNGKGV